MLVVCVVRMLVRARARDLCVFVLVFVCVSGVVCAAAGTGPHGSRRGWPCGGPDDTDSRLIVERGAVELYAVVPLTDVIGDGPRTDGMSIREVS